MSGLVNGGGRVIGCPQTTDSVLDFICASERRIKTVKLKPFNTTFVGAEFHFQIGLASPMINTL